MTSQLLEMERAAEVEAAQESTSLCSPETAQAKGRALLNLRCTLLHAFCSGTHQSNIIPLLNVCAEPSACQLDTAI